MTGWGAALGALAPVIGGLIGQGQAASAETDAENARKEALSQFGNIKPPTVEEQLLALQEYQTQGTINPLLEQLMQQGDSRLSDVQVDPRLKADQMNALEQISGLASGKIQPGDMAGFELARRNAAAEAQAKQGQILQDMQQRGQAGSGAELLARLKASQSGADMLSQAQMEEAKAMQAARMQALQQQANMASGIRQQDYGEQSDLARARDAISQFNANNAQNVQGRNVAAQNNAQQQNLTNKQNIANMNVGTQNDQQLKNKQLLQQQFDNQLRLAGARAGQYQNMAQASQNQAAGIAGMWSGLGQAAGTGLASMGSSAPSNSGIVGDQSIADGGTSKRSSNGFMS